MTFVNLSSVIIPSCIFRSVKVLRALDRAIDEFGPGGMVDAPACDLGVLVNVPAGDEEGGSRGCHTWSGLEIRCCGSARVWRRRLVYVHGSGCK